MAEFLIYNKNHWMDYLTQEQITNYIKIDPDFLSKYERRLQSGDVMEVHEDEWYRDRGFNREIFAVLKIPNLIDPLLSNYTDPLTTGIDAEEHVIKRRRYNFSNIIFDPIEKIAILPSLGTIIITDKAVV